MDNGDDHRARRVIVASKKHAQVGLRVHRIVIMPELRSRMFRLGWLEVGDSILSAHSGLLGDNYQVEVLQNQV